jgi:hypothetical protein
MARDDEGLSAPNAAALSRRWAEGQQSMGAPILVDAPRFAAAKATVLALMSEAIRAPARMLFSASGLCLLTKTDSQHSIHFPFSETVFY